MQVGCRSDITPSNDDRWSRTPTAWADFAMDTSIHQPDAPQPDRLIDLEARHEELLRQLDELDRRVERVLAECQVYRTSHTAAA